MRKRYFIYLMLFLLTTINYIDRVALSMAIPQIRQEFGLSPVQTGYLLSSFVWLYLAALIPMGMIVDKIGARAVSAWGIAIWSLATALITAAGSFVFLMAARLILGIGEATSYPAGGSVLRKWSPAQERGLAAAVLNAGSVIGPAIGAVGFGWTISSYGWRTAFLIAAVIGFVWLAAWLSFYKSPEEASWLNADERRHILTTRGSDVVSTDDGPRLGLAGIVRSPVFWAIAFPQGCAAYGILFFLTWLPSYFQIEKGLSLMNSGATAAIPYLGAGILAIVIGRLGDAFVSRGTRTESRRRIMVAISLLISSGIFAVPLVGTLWSALIVLTISLAGCTAAISGNFSLIGDVLSGEKDSGTAFGFVMCGGNAIGLLAPIVTGYAIKSTGHYDLAFIITGALLVLGALVSLVAMRKVAREPELIKKHTRLPGST